MSSDYTYKKGLVYKNQYHVIWCPKYRRPVLIGEVETRLKEIMPDHVHLFLDFDPRLSLHAW